MDAFGLRPRIEEMAQRIADWGYVVLAPNVFYRDGTADELAPDRGHDHPEGREAAGKARVPAGRPPHLRTRRCRTSMRSSRRWQRSTASRRARSATSGYCMGARLAVRTATAHPDVVAACGGFHGGGLATDAADSPHLGSGNARARFVFGHADHDRAWIRTPSPAWARPCDAAGLRPSNEIYAGAPHGYSMADTSMFHAEATERHFPELRALLDGTLKA